MRKKGENRQTIIRSGQRAHAKLRFQQRFGPEMNRDRIHEIEIMISSGRAILAEKKLPGIKNYLVGIEGRLIAVGYNSSTHRVVTALPEEYLGRLPHELLTTARLKLLREEGEKVIKEIVEGRAELIYQKTKDLAFYRVVYDGCTFRVGYNRVANKLVNYEKKSTKAKQPGSKTCPSEHSLIFPVINLDQRTADEFWRQIVDRQAALLWTYSETFSFYEVECNGVRMKVGHSNTQKTWHEYSDPPETMPELRSSIRFLDLPTEVKEAIIGLASIGNAEVVRHLSDNSTVYRAEWEAEVYYFVYSDYDGKGRIGTYQERTVSEEEKRVFRDRIPMIWKLERPSTESGEECSSRPDTASIDGLNQ